MRPQVHASVMFGLSLLLGGCANGQCKVRAKETVASEHQSALGAKERATVILGVDAARAEATKVRYKDDFCPFVGRQFFGLLVWQVELAGVSLGTHEYCGELTLTEDLKSLLHVRLRKASNVRQSDVWPPPLANVAEGRIRGDSGEEWVGLVQTDARHSLRDVLRIIDRDFGFVYDADELWVYFIMWRDSYRQAPRPMWSIEARAFSDPPFGQQVMANLPDRRIMNANAVNHLRHLVFDDEDRWWSSTTSPQPDPPNVGGDHERGIPP